MHSIGNVCFSHLCACRYLGSLCSHACLPFRVYSQPLFPGSFISCKRGWLLMDSGFRPFLMHSDIFFQVSGRDGKIPRLVRFKLFLCLSSFPVASTSTLPLACQNNSYQRQHESWKLWVVISFLERESVTYNRISSRDEDHLRLFPLFPCECLPPGKLTFIVIHVLKERHCI